MRRRKFLLLTVRADSHACARCRLVAHFVGSPTGRARQLCPGSSDIDFFSYFNRVVNLNAEIANSAFDLGVAKEQLDGAQIAGAPVDQSCFGSAKRVRTELQRVKTDAGDPPTDQPSVLPGRKSIRAIATSREQNVTALPGRHPQIIVESLAGLLSQFKADWATSLLLAHRRAVEGIAIRGHVINSNRNHVAASQLAIDSEVKQREVAPASLDLQLGSNRPDVTCP
jgi:hypothetical protein